MPTFQSARWCFTVNNPTDADASAIAELGDGPLTRYLVVGREIGESGTRHLQGFVIFHQVQSRAAVSGYIARAHLEPARASSVQASDYCKKDGDFDEYGVCPRSGQRFDLQALLKWGDDFIASHKRAPTAHECAVEQPAAYLKYPRLISLFQARAPPPDFGREGERRPWQHELEDELEGPCDNDRRVTFIVDQVGGAGKTWFQQWFLSKNPARAQIVSIGKRDDVAHTIDETKEVFFFAVPRGQMEFLRYEILEMLKDRMVFSPKYASRMKFLSVVPHVIVFSNELPDMNKMSLDRYYIKEVN